MLQMRHTANTYIEGVWLIDIRIFDEPGILVMLSDGRAVQFPTSQSKPRLQQPMRLWHSVYDGKQVRFRPCQSAKGWVRGVEPAQDGWIMTTETEREQLRFHCTKLFAELFPDWYEAMLAINLEKMTVEEKKMNEIQKIQKWYRTQCNGDWEHLAWRTIEWPEGQDFCPDTLFELLKVIA